MYLFRAQGSMCFDVYYLGRGTYTERKSMKCCDNCIYYKWYFDWCTKWKCEMDYRSVCDFWKNDKENWRNR